MSHQSRLESPTKLYHVYGRGVDKKEIFQTKDEKNYFLKCMYEIKNLYPISIYAYCIMPNHYHMVIEGELKDIANFMQNCLGRYGITYNAYHARDGHVFQGKYKSKTIMTERYFWSLIRYIHLNPVKALLVDNPSQYIWSSYPEYIHRGKQKGLLSHKAVQLMKRNFPDGMNFQLFHGDSDHMLYDDIDEDIELQKKSIALIAARDIREKTGVCTWKDAWSEVDYRKEIVLLLMNEYHYSLKEVCELLSVSEYKLKKALDTQDKMI